MERDPRPGEDDVDQDDAQALSRGGEEVGQAVGQDVGYAGETGAERRAEWEKEQGPSSS